MAFTQYLGFDVLEIEPSPDDPSSQLTRSNFRFDPRTGKVKVTDKPGVAIVEPRKFRWLMDGRAEIQVYRDFIAARVGACVPFWVPSWRYDVPVSTTMLATTTALVIQRIGFTKYYFPYNARHHLAFIMPDKTKYYRKAIGAADGSATETISIDSGIPVAIPPGTMVATLSLCRLAADDPELTWHNLNLAETTLDFVELPLEVPA